MKKQSIASNLLLAIGIVLTGNFQAGCKSPAPVARQTIEFTEINSPTHSGASVPTLSIGGDKAFYLVWVEPASEKVNRLLFAKWDGKQWSSSHTITEDSSVLAHISGEPKLLALDEQHLAAAWMATTKGAKDPEATSLQVSFSKDGGSTWSAPTPSSDDKTEGEHEYASLYSLNSQFGMAWLDPRRTAPAEARKAHSHEPAATILMATTFTKEGGHGKEFVMADSVCDCCPISTVTAAQGPVMVYRNRDHDETRDIYITKFEGTNWLPGHPVYRDGWRIEGCPTNAAHVDVLGEEMVVAWFTGAGDIGRVKVAYSSDSGDHFDEPITVDEDRPVGHVSSVALPDRGAIISWVGHSGSNRALYTQEIHANGQRGLRQTIQNYPSNAALGFPVMAQNSREILLAWTDSEGSKVRVARALLPVKR